MIHLRSAYFSIYCQAPEKHAISIEFDANSDIRDVISFAGKALGVNVNDPDAWCLLSHGNFVVKQSKDLIEGAEYSLVSQAFFRLILSRSGPRNEDEVTP